MDFFECTAERIGEASAVVTVKGDLDLHTSTRLAEVLKELAEDGITDRIVVDLSGCGFMDSTGLGVLAKARLTRSPMDVVTSPVVSRFFMLAGVAKLFTLHRRRAEAVAALESRVGVL